MKRLTQTAITYWLEAIEGCENAPDLSTVYHSFNTIYPAPHDPTEQEKEWVESFLQAFKARLKTLALEVAELNDLMG